MGTAARQVNGAGLNLICGVGGCRVALPAPVIYPTVAYPAYGYPGFGYGAYPGFIGTVNPFYGPVVTTPYVGGYFNAGYW